MLSIAIWIFHWNEYPRTITVSIYNSLTTPDLPSRTSELVNQLLVQLDSGSSNMNCIPPLLRTLSLAPAFSPIPHDKTHFTFPE